jgi:hypothetical protein
VLVTDLENELVIEPFYSAKVHLGLESGSKLFKFSRPFQRSIALLDEFLMGPKCMQILAGIFVISLRIKTGRQRGHKQLF